MIVNGHDIEPGDDRTLVSLVDIAPTLGGLAGIPREPDWVGSSLFAIEPKRPTFAFRLEGPNADEVTIHSGGHKLSALPDPEALRRGEVLEAFDLGVDPGELENLRDEDWPSELAQEMADAVEFFLRAKADAGSAETDADLKRGLEDIGYTGN